MTSARERMRLEAERQATERAEREGVPCTVYVLRDPLDPERDTWYVRSPDEGKPVGAQRVLVVRPPVTVDRDELEEAVARTLTLCAVADAVERCEEELEPDYAEHAETLAEFHPGAGGEWNDSIPPGAPLEAQALAVRVLEELEALNPGRSAEAMAAEWCELSGEEPERFSHCLALEYLGHGVGLGDDIPPRADWPGGRPRTPRGEFSSWDFDLLAFLGVAP